MEKKVLSMAFFVALGVLLHRVEALLPLPSPWIKLGLANVMTLAALVFLGRREALVVTGVRVVIASVLAGTFLGPTFFLSLAGGMSAAAVMVWLYRSGAGPFSLIGVSVAGACAHTLAIVFCVFFLFMREEAFLRALPVFLTLALLSGVLMGVVADKITCQLARAGIVFK